MRITIMTVGSRGDVQQFVALGCGLAAAGYEVRFATHPEFRAFVEEYGLGFAPVSASPFDGLNADLTEASERQSRPDEPLQARIRRAMEDWIRGGLEAARGSDALIFTQLCFIGAHVAEALRIPGIQANHSPASRTGAFPTIYLPWDVSFGPVLNRLTHVLDERTFWLMNRRVLNRLRTDALGLDPLPFSGPQQRAWRTRAPMLYSFSEHVVPKPDDWGDWLEVCGFWFLERRAEWTPDPGLERFLESGPPPVYLGLGSVAGANPRTVTLAALAALARRGTRTLVMPGRVDLGGAELPPETFVLGSVPHDWLFPRTAGVIHHGGPGTVATAMRAGVPSLGIPFFGDQFFWARRVGALGVGPAPIPARRVTRERMDRALDELLSDATRDRARMLGARIRTEDGIGNAVRAVERWVGSPRAAGAPAPGRSAAGG